MSALISNCTLCKHFFDGPQMGVRTTMCRRYPPKVVEMTEGNGQKFMFSLYPAVGKMNYCGEFALAEGPIADRPRDRRVS